MQNLFPKIKLISPRFIQALIAFCLTVCGIFTIVSCNENHTDKVDIPIVSEDEVAVYFIKVVNKRPKLEVSYRPLSEDKKEKRLFYAISALVKGPSKAEKNTVGSEIPKETRLISYYDKPDRAIVNLTDQFRSGGGSRTMIMRYKQLYYTVAANAGEKPVYVQIEGKPFKRLGGEGLVTDDPIYEGKE